jgi:hypothetical protein
MAFDLSRDNMVAGSQVQKLDPPSQPEEIENDRYLSVFED